MHNDISASDHATRIQRGQALIETSVGILIFVILSLFIVDVCFVMLAKIENDDLARRAARAAADHDETPYCGEEMYPRAAAQNVVSGYNGRHGLISELRLNPDFGEDGIKYLNLGNPANAPQEYKDHIAVSIKAKVNLPFPVPFCTRQIDLVSQFTQPWVASSTFRADIPPD
jgi:hypothetical protein